MLSSKRPSFISMLTWPVQIGLSSRFSVVRLDYVFANIFCITNQIGSYVSRHTHTQPTYTYNARFTCATNCSNLLLSLSKKRIQLHLLSQFLGLKVYFKKASTISVLASKVQQLTVDAAAYLPTWPRRSSLWSEMLYNSSSRSSMRLDDLTSNGTQSRTGGGGAGSRVQEFDVLSLHLSQNGSKLVPKLDQLLHEAVIKNDLQRVQALLEGGIKTSSTIHVSAFQGFDDRLWCV